MKEHLDIIHSISLEDLNQTSRTKIEMHINASINVNKAIDTEDPQKLKQLIEYLAMEGRGFGWSFPENPKEERCERSFWDLNDKMKQLIGGMTRKERLSYFGYLKEFENIPAAHKSARDEILLKLYMPNLKNHAP